MKLIILAGGLGTRMREETEFKPKPMVEIGGKPILWHIMNHFAKFGVNEFIVATGYKSEYIKDYFLNYEARNKDFTIQLGSHATPEFHSDSKISDWKVTVADTGAASLTGERVKRAAKYLEPNEKFMVTYGDGVSNVDIKKLIEFHNSRNLIATVTAVRPVSRFGVLDLNENDEVVNFREKPQSDNWINVGYFVFEYEALNYLDDGPLEENPLRKLATENQLNAYRHEGFWQPMDTVREVQILNTLWETGQAPWVIK